MTRIYLSLTAAAVFTLAGCAKNQDDDTQTPDSGDVAAEGEGGEAAAGPDRARDSTSTRSTGSKTRARVKVATDRPPRAEPTTPTDDGPNGLAVEAFSLDSADAMPNFSSFAEAAATFTIPNLDVDDDATSAGFPGYTDGTVNYALRFTGSLNIIDEAEYELCLHSDDGSQLLLEDTMVVDNDGVHDEAKETCELVYLAPGEYSLEVRYFQADGENRTLHFAWAQDGGEKVIVPTEVLFKPVAG